MDLNWTDEEYENYQGEDLILGTGVPGSRWSGVFKALMYVSHVNSTNVELQYGKKFFNTDRGEIKTYGWHYGTYWGPYHEHGNDFDKLNKMTKKEIIQEFAAPFDSWDRVKLVKSHWFVYHLELLTELFPRARIIGAYLPNDISFRWWHKLGGWDIGYPPYDWFVNDERMKKHIKIGNALMLAFFTERGIEFKSHKGYKEMFAEELHLPYEYKGDHKNKVPATLIAVYSPLKGHGENLLLKSIVKNYPDVLRFFDILVDVDSKPQ
jgi:hypothetical protein